MPRPVFTTEFWIAPETTYADPTTMPLRKIVSRASITPEPVTEDITTEATGTKLEVTRTDVVGLQSRVSFTGAYYGEYTPWLTQATLGTGTQLTKTIPDASAGTNPNQVMQIVSSVSVDEITKPQSYSVWQKEIDGRIKVVRGFFAQTWTGTANPGGRATYTLTGIGHSPQDWTAPNNFVEPVEVANKTPIISTNETFAVNASPLPNLIKSTSFTIASGFRPRRYGAGLEIAGILPGTANSTITINAGVDSTIDALRDAALELDHYQTMTVFNGTSIRSNPEHNRVLQIDLYGQLINPSAFDEEDDGERTANFTFQSRANADGKHIEITAIVANDAGGIV